MKSAPDFLFENESGFTHVAGVDEAGRGPLCGPVVAGAVMFLHRDIEIPVVIRDSKQMSAGQRAAAFKWITTCPDIVWSVGQCSAAEIDEMNILWASMCAMTRAVAGLRVRADFCLVDGNRVPAEITGRAIVRGDAKSLSIAAASIVAKETRDGIMRELAEKYPQYGWDKNAGYPTASHLQAIEKYGINEHYRKTYGPIKQRIKDETSRN